MADELKYILWGLAMLMHSIYMLISHQVSFGWDTIILEGKMLYLIILPYMLFSIWIIIISIISLRKKS